jgi:hypothetical protein
MSSHKCLAASRQPQMAGHTLLGRNRLATNDGLAAIGCRKWLAILSVHWAASGQPIAASRFRPSYVWPAICGRRFMARHLWPPPPMTQRRQL